MKDYEIVCGDKDELEQVLVELADFNVVYYHNPDYDDGLTIEIEGELQKFDGTEDEGDAKLAEIMSELEATVNEAQIVCLD